MELLTAAQMRAIERAAIESGEVTGLDLMERAGRGVVEAIFEWRPELAEGVHSACVLCGPGNNGGDGFVVARLLKERGWTVEVFLYGNEAKLPPDAAENARRWREMGDIHKLIAHEFNEHPSHLNRAPGKILVVDALFGTGLKHPLENDLAVFLDETGSADLGVKMYSVIAIDAPSGLCLDSGKSLPVCNQADLTVTFHTAKVGHFLGFGPAACGKIVVRPIGLVRDIREAAYTARLANLGWSIMALDKSFDERLGKSYLRWKRHKYTHGHALILSGGMGRSGAARLAARGALRIGAGLVTVGAPGSAMLECATQLTAIMLRKVDDLESFASILADERINALCLGPGLGLGHKTELLVTSALEAGRATVLDADALSVFAEDPDALFARLHENCVLTPHEGEFGRLFPDILEKLNAPALTGPAYSKVDATREAAARAGCVVLFKGPDTVIADRDGRCVVNSAHYERAAPWLATAGSGDVLAGMITGLLARGLRPMPAAESAAWLHVECGRRIGPGLIAEDIPEALPQVLRHVLGWSPPA